MHAFTLDESNTSVSDTVSRHTLVKEVKTTATKKLSALGNLSTFSQAERLM